MTFTLNREDKLLGISIKFRSLEWDLYTVITTRRHPAHAQVSVPILSPWAIVWSVYDIPSISFKVCSTALPGITYPSGWKCKGRVHMNYQYRNGHYICAQSWMWHINFYCCRTSGSQSQKQRCDTYIHPSFFLCSQFQISTFLLHKTKQKSSAQELAPAQKAHWTSHVSRCWYRHCYHRILPSLAQGSRLESQGTSRGVRLVFQYVPPWKQHDLL